MKRLKCECCGGNLRENPLQHNSYTCEYCGAMYKDENEQVYRVETFQNPVSIYQAEVCMYRQISQNDPKGYSEYSIKNLALELADAIVKNMDLEISYDPRLDCDRIRGRVRIVQPKYLF